MLICKSVKCFFCIVLTRMPPSVRIRVRIVAIPPGTQHVTKIHSPNLAEISARTQLGQQSVHIPIYMQKKFKNVSVNALIVYSNNILKNFHRFGKWTAVKV